MGFLRRRRLFVILVSIIVLIGLIGFSLSDRGGKSTAEQFVRDAVGWMQSVIHAPVALATNVITNIDDMKQTYEENQLLKSRLAEYKTVLEEVQTLRRDNEDLRSILDKTESITDYTPIQASIISHSPEQWFQVVTINKGLQDGVQDNMAVITGEGMVGKIQATSQFTSTVLLLSGFDRSNRISVSVSVKEEGNASGFIVGYDEDSQSLLLELNEYDTSLTEGDPVFSSGMGGVFPSNLIIGTVKEVTPDKYGLTQVAYVTPAANLSDVNHVIVVDRLAAMPPETQSGDEEEQE
ncbi:rod shape-determining protein MreC [Radiobacillus sp. PE A8.2]|uniref:rod shape-determining protein MreC n=1 Tax=Radiobacillus sp. PE A8.2 TaxID=3380349 RepID=UPI00388D27D6